MTSVVLCNLDCQGQEISVILHFVYFEEIYSIFILNSFPFHKPQLIILTISTNKDWLWLWYYGSCLFSLQISYHMLHGNLPPLLFAPHSLILTSENSLMMMENSLHITLWNVHDLATIPTNISQTVWAGSNFFFKPTESPLRYLEVEGSTPLVLWQVQINVKHLGVLIAERQCCESLGPFLRTYQQNSLEETAIMWKVFDSSVPFFCMCLIWGCLGLLLKDVWVHYPIFQLLEDKPKPL